MINVEKVNKYLSNAFGQMEGQNPQIRPQTLPSLPSRIRDQLIILKLDAFVTTNWQCAQ